MIGDRLETDVLMGLNAGMAGALTLTGATDLAVAGRVHRCNPLTCCVSWRISFRRRSDEAML